jgi:mannose-6-phosphate isomerase-like protein (cupin superfamily)
MRKDESVEILKSAGVYTAPGSAPNHYVEHLSVPELSVGTYSIPAGGLDDQTPHTEDEIYVVTAGHARIVTAGGSAEIDPGSVIYVPAAEEHHFVDITEDLCLVVVFAPPYESRASGV